MTPFLPAIAAILVAAKIPRGEVGLIFAGVGATAMVAGTPVFDGETFAAIVAMVMVTTLATPPLLRAAFPRATGGGRARQEPAVDTYSGCT